MRMSVTDWKKAIEFLSRHDPYVLGLEFFKLEGAGNDFIFLDWRDRAPLDGKMAASLGIVLSDRRRGIGADGLILLEGVESSGADFRMRLVNANGQEGEMCGNGARCAARFAKLLGFGDRQVIETAVGSHQAILREDGEISIGFPDIREVPVLKRIAVGTKDVSGWFINTGVPHFVHYIEGEIGEVNLEDFAPPIRYHRDFQNGTNVNVAKVDGPMKVRCRTFERGVEGETLACGTGAVAVACSHLRELGMMEAGTVELTPSGGVPLKVHLLPMEWGFAEVWLTGPARVVFRGKISQELFTA